MDAVNKTLYIPLYGKALVSRNGILLRDEMAERIWEDSGFSLTGKAASKWLAYSMAMRAAVFDRWTAKMQEEHPEAIVLHLGCGLDSRCLRAAGKGMLNLDSSCLPETLWQMSMSMIREISEWDLMRKL